jgi:hypothetical protein
MLKFAGLFSVAVLQKDIFKREKNYYAHIYLSRIYTIEKIL